MMSQARRYVCQEFADGWLNNLPLTMIPIPSDVIVAAKMAVPEKGITCLGAWRSRYFLAVLYCEARTGAKRLSVNRTKLVGDRWVGDITWDDLMQVKRECGLGDVHAIEFYPADDQVVDVANMRHLWLLDEPHPWMWQP